MNRTDRLYALAEELRRVGPAGTTSTRLARLFEVSARTVKRDVSALQQAGLPVAAQAGLGGGYVLEASVGLPPVNFTPAQAVALALAVRALPPGSPFGTDADAARAKVLDALPPDARRRADALAARVWSRPAPAEGPGAEVLRAVEESLDRSRVLAIEYGGVGRLGESSADRADRARAHGRPLVPRRVVPAARRRPLVPPRPGRARRPDARALRPAPGRVRRRAAAGCPPGLGPPVGPPPRRRDARRVWVPTGRLALPGQTGHSSESMSGSPTNRGTDGRA